MKAEGGLSGLWGGQAPAELEAAGLARRAQWFRDHLTDALRAFGERGPRTVDEARALKYHARRAVDLLNEDPLLLALVERGTGGFKAALDQITRLSTGGGVSAAALVRAAIVHDPRGVTPRRAQPRLELRTALVRLMGVGYQAERGQWPTTSARGAATTTAAPGTTTRLATTPGATTPGATTPRTTATRQTAAAGWRSWIPRGLTTGGRR